MAYCAAASAFGQVGRGQSSKEDEPRGQGRERCAPIPRQNKHGRRKKKRLQCPPEAHPAAQVVPAGNGDAQRLLGLCPDLLELLGLQRLPPGLPSVAAQVQHVLDQEAHAARDLGRVAQLPQPVHEALELLLAGVAALARLGQLLAGDG